MSDTTTLPAPDISLNEAAHASWEEHRRAFFRLLPTLLAKYRGQYVAVHEGALLRRGRTKSRSRSRHMWRSAMFPSMSGWTPIAARPFFAFLRPGCSLAEGCDGSLHLQSASESPGTVCTCHLASPVRRG